MNLYDEILAASKVVDDRFATITPEELMSFQTSFVVPDSHSRSKDIETYDYRVGDLKSIFSNRKTLVFVDQSLKNIDWIKSSIPVDAEVFWFTPSEEFTKECSRLDSFIQENKLSEKSVEVVVAIGGGVIINTAGYVAEKLGCDLVYVPTTVLAMADASISGKVRANQTVDGFCRKHAYKSYYEPNLVLIDQRFLSDLPEKQISIGLGEIIKHGVYQSKDLLEYLVSDAFNPFTDRFLLLKTILWAADLSAVCLNIDPEESKDGAAIIMRGGHDASDKIEEASGFTIPHGTAVAQAIRAELTQSQSPLLTMVEKCFAKFQIPALDIADQAVIS